MYHARASHRWPLMNNQYIPLKTIRESCGCLAGGASERAGCVGLMLMEQFNMAKECQLIEFEDIVGLRGPQCLPTGQVAQRCMNSVVCHGCCSFISLNLSLKQQHPHENRMQTHSQTGHCEIYCTNFSRRTNAAVLGIITFIMSSDSNPAKNNIATQ